MNQQKIVSWEEVGQHITPSNCWVVVDGSVYNVTDFLVEHPGGDEILVKWSGLDATQAFNKAKHSEYAISLRNARLVGRVQPKSCPQSYEQMMKKMKSDSFKKTKKVVPISEPISRDVVKNHNSEQNCWIIINGKVYDVTTYLENHPGGVNKIMEWAGQDATQAFQAAGHSLEALKIREEFSIGNIQKNGNNSLILIGVGILLLICLAMYSSS